MTDAPPIRILATGPDWSWVCNGAIAIDPNDRSRRWGQCACGWKTSDVHPSRIQELLDLCEQHLATSGRRRDEYRRSLPPDPRTIEELDAEIRAGLDEIRGIVGAMEERYG